MATQNETVFAQSDMVVAIRQKTLNDQFRQLVDQGVIQSQLIVYQDVVGQDFHYVLTDSVTKIPANRAFLNAKVLPQIEIPQSGTNINFVLTFQSGTACLWEGDGPLAKLVQYEMAGWSYSIGVGLNLTDLVKSDLGQKIKAPDLATQQLTQFLDEMFTVRHLLLDFQSVDLVKSAHATTGGASDKGTQSFVEFMSFWLNETTKAGNPCILGYSLTTTDQTRVPADQQVPDELKPVGANFSLYKDPANPDNSTLCYVLATKGGHGKVAGNPPVFDSNWIGPGEACQGKLIYSHAVFLERFVIMPVFNQIREGVYNSIKDQVSVGIGNDYNAAKQMAPDHWTFTIANDTDGNDQYTNAFTVQFRSQPGVLEVAFHGNMSVYKGVSKDCFFCTARAHASGQIEWGGSAFLKVTADAKGNAMLSLENSFRVINSNKESDQNSCADAFDWIGKILGGILDVFTGFLDNGYFGNLFANAFSVNIPGIGNLNVAFGNLGNAVRSLVMLPSGAVFTFQNPAANSEGDLSLQLNYR